MIQIISNSNETSTGPELVQNGDFSQLGTDLVENGEFDELGTDVITNGNFATDTDWTKGNGWSIGDNKATSTQALGSEEVTNGDFSAAGINLVDNPNFTDTGIELVDNNDFSNGTTDWTAVGASSISVGTHEGRSDVADINITGTGAGNRIEQPFTYVANKSYKVTVDVYVVSGSFRIDSRDAFVSGDFLSTSTTGSWQTLTGYITATASGSNYIWLRSMLDGGIGEISQFYVDSVSIKELGADWTILADTCTFGENGLTMTTTGGIDALIRTNDILSDLTSYKVTYTIHENGLTGTNSIQYYTGSALNQYDDLPYQDEGTHTFYYTTPSSTNERWFFRVDLKGGSTSTTDFVTISSISVQELGEGWTVGGGWSIGEDKAISTLQSGSKYLSQYSIVESGKSYKVTYEVIDYTSGSVKATVSGDEGVARTSIGTYTEILNSTGSTFSIKNQSGLFIGSVSNVSVKEIATSYLTQAVSLSAKTWKIIYSVSDYIAGSVSATDYGAVTTADAVGITEYVEIGAISDFRMVNIDGYFEGAVTGISAQLVDPNGYWSLGSAWSFGDGKVSCDGSVSTSNLSQTISSFSGKSFLVKGSLSNVTQGFVYISLGGTDLQINLSASGDFERYVTIASGNSTFYVSARNNFIGSVTNISVEQLDPNDYWTLGMGWSIGTDKAISTVTGSNSDITQSILTAGKTYRTVYEIVDYDAGTAQAVVTGSEGADAVAIETYTEDLTTTGTDFSIRSKLGTFDGSVSSVSAKLLGSYEDQSIYVTAADVQTLPQASVYYLVELTSMGSENSLYFLPSSVVANNGRYTKLNFTVVSKDALTQPTVGIISFYDSAGGFDTYPMGFYEFKIYEQTSSTNLDPLLATGLLEKGFAFVRDFSGNMQELTDGFKEYNPTLTQYVYSK